MGFANVPRGDEPARGEVEAITAEEWQRRLAEPYAEDAGFAVRLVEPSNLDDIATASPMHSIPHLPVWHTGRMVVIGDAAHAPTPTSGQGAPWPSRTPSWWPRACVTSRPKTGVHPVRGPARPRVERIIRTAARFNSNKAAGPVARVVRDAILPVVLKLTANSRQVNQQYRYHIAWDTPSSSLVAAR